MPSGAKKRKAAKKKMEQKAKQITINNGVHSHGIEEPRSQDEKESDGDSSSPVSPGTIEPQLSDARKSGPPAVQSSGIRTESAEEATQETKRNQKAELDNEGVITFERELKAQKNEVEKIDDFRPKNVSATENNTLQDAGVNSVQETVSVVDSIKRGASESEKVICAEAKADESSKVTEAVRLKSNGSKENSLPELDKESVCDMLPSATETSSCIDNPEHSSEKETHSAPVLSVARRTSWLSCCGLFD